MARRVPSLPRPLGCPLRCPLIRLLVLRPDSAPPFAALRVPHVLSCQTARTSRPVARQRARTGTHRQHGLRFCAAGSPVARRWLANRGIDGNSRGAARHRRGQLIAAGAGAVVRCGPLAGLDRPAPPALCARARSRRGRTFAIHRRQPCAGGRTFTRGTQTFARSAQTFAQCALGHGTDAAFQRVRSGAGLAAAARPLVCRAPPPASRG